jgi:SpoVK/Ycf46/Vps4 family AAA+-type ATPase
MPFPTEIIKRFIAAKYPILYLVSWEEERVERMVKLLGTELFTNTLKFYTWSCIAGMRNNEAEISETRDVIQALDRVISDEETGFYLFKDLHFFLSDPSLIRKLRDIYQILRSSYKTLFILSPELVLPNELQKEITVVDIGLPDMDELGKIFDMAVASNKNSETIKSSLTPALREKCIRALLGLGSVETGLALTRTLIGREGVDEGVVDALLEEKAQLVRKSGTLEFVRARIGLDDIGGLENLKEWLQTRALAFSAEAKKFGLDMPKGLLIMGISGCGKSLCAKAVATAWDLPLMRLDLNQVYSGASGSPEEAFQRAVKTVEAIAPCVLWIDEIEAGITRSGEKTSDSATSRIFGYFLTWMQEKQYPVFVAATANRIDLLPPEILRKGRFDEIFFVPLPSEKERREIFRIHLLSRGRNPELFDLDSLAKNTEGLSGAEIEQAVVSALFESFSKRKELDDIELIIASSSMVPLSTTMREEISRLERWAFNRAVKASK